MSELKLFVVVSLLFLLVVVNAQSACVNLGTAASFGLLGGSAVTNAVPGTVILGDIGVSPGSSITGFPPGVISGTEHVTDAVAAQAQSDLTAAYLAAAGASCTLTHNLTGIDLGTFNAGNPLLPGVYCFSSSAGLTGNLTLDAKGDPNACWIFQIGSSLITATGATVTLINGANPCNVFWQVGSSATIQTGNVFAGTIMALTSITLNGGTLNGRALARNGAVTVSGSEFVNTVCAPVLPCVHIAKKTDRSIAAINDTITYTYTVCNCGTTTLSINSVIDSKEGNLTSNFTAANGSSSTLAAGACVVFTKTHTVTAQDGLTLTNSVTVDSQDSGGTHATSTDQASVTITQSLLPTNCVHMTKVGNRITAAVGNSVIYTYTVCNCGTSTLTVDSVTDSLVGDLTSLFTAANGSSSTLAAGACVTFTDTYTVKATDTSPLTNLATVDAHSGATPVTSTDQWTVTIVPGPCVSVGKTANRASATNGDQIVYTFAVCNCGTVPLTVSSVADSLLGELITDFKAANAGNSSVAPGKCVTFTETYTVKASDPSPLINTVTVTANAGDTVVTDSSQVSTTIEQVLFQAFSSSSEGAAPAFRGYLGPGVDSVTAAPGVFQIVPGPSWSNFVRVTDVNGNPIAYSVKNVTLVKQTPNIIQCADVFPVKTIRQQGTPNIRLQWPLMYEIPGTTWTLTILIGTTVPSIVPGDSTPAFVHTIVWNWSVGANINSMKNLLALFHELPFGTDEVPLISNEALYPILQAKLTGAGIAIAGGDTVTTGAILGDFEMEVMDACIATSPRFPNPVIGAGIANTTENPACCKLLADTEFVGFQSGGFQTGN